MLTITAKSDRKGIFSICAEGHSGFAENGLDIVCASISSLVQALWLGFEEVIRVEELEAVSDQSVPRIYLRWNSGIESAQLLARTILLSIKAIAEGYPDYVKINEVFEFEEDKSK